MTDNIDWKALLRLYMDHVDAQEGVDFIDEEFRRKCENLVSMNEQQKTEFNEFIDNRRKEREARRRQFRDRLRRPNG